MADKKNYLTVPRPKKLQASKIDKRIDLGEALRLRFSEHWTFEQIANKYGVTRAAVEKRLRKYTKLIKDSEMVEAYDKNKQTLLSEAEFSFITSILGGNKIESANLTALVNALKTIYDMNRLEKGKSTANIAISLEERLDMLEGKK